MMAVSKRDLKIIGEIVILLVATSLIKDPIISWVTTHIKINPFWLGMGLLVLAAYLFTLD